MKQLANDALQEFSATYRVMRIRAGRKDFKNLLFLPIMNIVGMLTFFLSYFTGIYYTHRLVTELIPNAAVEKGKEGLYFWRRAVNYSYWGSYATAFNFGEDKILKRCSSLYSDGYLPFAILQMAINHKNFVRIDKLVIDPDNGMFFSVAEKVEKAGELLFPEGVWDAAFEATDEFLKDSRVESYLAAMLENDLHIGNVGKDAEGNVKIFDPFVAKPNTSLFHTHFEGCENERYKYTYFTLERLIHTAEKKLGLTVEHGKGGIITITPN